MGILKIDATGRTSTARIDKNHEIRVRLRTNFLNTEGQPKKAANPSDTVELRQFYNL